MAKLLLMGFMLLCSVASASATVINFDDLSGSNFLPVNYAGLTWSTNWNYYDSFQPPYTPSSGNERAYITNNSGNGTISFVQNVTFQGSWIASYDIGQEMWWEGYNNGAKLFESIHLAGGTASFLTLNWAGVDEVRFLSTVGQYNIIDDITFNNSLNPVPEPSTFFLLGAGIAGLGFLKRKKGK